MGRNNNINRQKEGAGNHAGLPRGEMCLEIMNGPESMLSMLTGHGGPGDSMWEALGTPDPHKMTPDPNEMQAKMAAAQYVRHADLVAIESRIYDLSDEQETTQYCKDREYLFVGVSMNTHFLLDHDKQFINDPDKPRWVVHMEWAVFELTEDAVEPVAEQEK